MGRNFPLSFLKFCVHMPTSVMKKELDGKYFVYRRCSHHGIQGFSYESRTCHVTTRIIDSYEYKITEWSYVYAQFSPLRDGGVSFEEEFFHKALIIRNRTRPSVFVSYPVEFFEFLWKFKVNLAVFSWKAHLKFAILTAETSRKVL